MQPCVGTCVSVPAADAMSMMVLPSLMLVALMVDDAVRALPLLISF